MTTPSLGNTRREFLRHLSASLALGFSCRPAVAEESSSPEAVARCALELFREESSAAFVRQFDAASASEFAARLIRLFQPLETDPREQAARSLGFATFSILQSAPPRDLLLHLLNAWHAANPEAVAALRECRLKTFGSVLHADQAYVPYRLVNELDEWIDLRIHPRVLTLRREGDRWAPQLLTDVVDLGAAFIANDYRVPPLRVEILGRLRDGEHFYFVNRQTYSFPGGIVRVVAANYANVTPAILAAAKANDHSAAERLIRAAIEDFYDGYLPLLKTRDELAKDIAASQSTET